MTPDGEARIHSYLESIVRACRSIEQLAPDNLDEQRLLLQGIEQVVKKALGVVDEEDPRGQARPAPCCSFCGKTQAEVTKLIAGPSATICDECIRLCDEIIAEEKDAVLGEPGEEGPAMAESDSAEGEPASSYQRSVPPSKSEP
jgi:hypothetical protein